MTDELTPEQIENWREVYGAIIGPYCYWYGAPIEKILQLRNRLRKIFGERWLKEESPDVL